MAKKDTHSPESRQLENIRRRIGRQIKKAETHVRDLKQYINSSSYNNLSDSEKSYHERRLSEMQANIEHLAEDRNKYMVKNITSSKYGSSDYKRDINAAVNSASDRYKASEIEEFNSRASVLSHEQFKRVEKVIMTATYGSVWKSGKKAGQQMTREEIREAIQKPVRESLGVYHPSEQQIMEYYEKAIKEGLSKVHKDMDFTEWTLEDIAGYDMEKLSTYTEKGYLISISVENMYAEYLGE